MKYMLYKKFKVYSYQKIKVLSYIIKAKKLQKIGDLMKDGE